MTREEILTIAKPILFNMDMVRSILDDKKTATRRKAEFLRGKNPNWTGYVRDGLMLYNGTNEPCIKPPRYKVGDYLYVRETWMVQAAKRFSAIARIWYRAGGQDTTIHFPHGDSDSINRDAYDAFVNKWRLNRWYPSIHMPKEAARIFLRVTDVRVERLQDITIDDVLREGISGVEPPPICIKGAREPEGFRSWSKDKQDDWIKSTATATYIGWCDYVDKLFYKMEYLWNSTIKEEDLSKYGWDANPWVWVIEFERVEVQ